MSDIERLRVTTQSKATAALLRAVADLAAPDLHVSTGVPEAGRTRCRASMTITGWPTRHCIEPRGHDGPHYAGDRHTWGVTWNAVDPDDYTGVTDE